MAIARGVAFADQAAGVFKFFGQQRLLVFTVNEHGVVGLDEAGLTLQAFFHGLEVGAQGGASRLKQLLLVERELPYLGVLRGIQHVGMKGDFALTELLGPQATLHGAQAQVALAGVFIVGPHSARVQPNQKLTFSDLLTFTHQHFFDQTTRKVLYGLAFCVEGDNALTRHALVQRCQPGPQQEATKAEAQGPQAHATRTAAVRNRCFGGNIGDINGRGAGLGRWIFEHSRFCHDRLNNQ